MKARISMLGMAVLIGLSCATSVPAADDGAVPVPAGRPTAAPAVEAAPGAVDPNFRRLVRAYRARLHDPAYARVDPTTTFAASPFFVQLQLVKW